jgi:monoamine oxidase
MARPFTATRRFTADERRMRGARRRFSFFAFERFAEKCERHDAYVCGQEPLVRERDVECDVAVVGAGAAGLIAARDLARAGFSGRMLEAGSAARIRQGSTRGAYWFLLIGGERARETLGESVCDTLYFAGEATATDGEGGTVAGALASGIRAANTFRSRRT